MHFRSVKSALVTVILFYCFVMVILSIITGILENISLSVSFGIMSCVAALGGILIVRFYNDNIISEEPPTDKINQVETQKFFDDNEKPF